MNEAMVSRAAIAKRGTHIRGYEAEVMQSVTRSTGTHVFLPRTDYDRLRKKYGGPPPGPGTAARLPCRCACHWVRGVPSNNC